MLHRIAYIIEKEFKLEWRHRSALGGIVLYAFATVFVCFLTFKNMIQPPVWNALFWIILLFSAINSIAKSFMSESQGRQLYFYTLFDPREVLLGKIIYNSLFLGSVALVTLLVYSLFIGNPVQSLFQFLLCLILGSFAFASVLTIVSSIASKTNGNLSLMAVLSFPMLIPLLITIIKASKNAMDGIDFSVNFPYLTVLVLVNAIVVMLGYILFPYLWRN
jgi:heme exporter protein B